MPPIGFLREQTAAQAGPAVQVTELAAPECLRGSSKLLSDGSIERKVFRLVSREPPSVTLLKRYGCPLVVTLLLALCLGASGSGFPSELGALLLVVLLLAVAVLGVPGSVGAAQDQDPLNEPVGLMRLLLEWLAVFSLTGVLVRALNLTGLLPGATLLAWFLVTPPALLLAKHGIVRYQRYQLRRESRASRHVIIGATEVGIELANRVQQGTGTSGFMGFFDFRDQGRLPHVPSEQWAGGCEGIADFVRKHAIDRIYIALPISTAPRIAALLQELRDTTASIYFVPNLLGFDLIQPRCIEIHGIPLLAICETPFHGMPGVSKRAADLILGVTALVVAAPLMLAIALAVKASSPGPVLFKQRRFGLNGEEVKVFKFRSMRVCEDGPVVTQATRNDQRITRLGALLRRTSLDELPQILNVIGGSMSLVGPRPHAVAHNEHYRRLISGFMIRHKVRPGITGWAQVNGLRGETDTIDKMQARVQYDLDYIKNWSLWLDFRIMLRTLLVFRGDRRAY